MFHTRVTSCTAASSPLLRPAGALPAETGSSALLCPAPGMVGPCSTHAPRPPAMVQMLAQLLALLENGLPGAASLLPGPGAAARPGMGAQPLAMGAETYRLITAVRGNQFEPRLAGMTSKSFTLLRHLAPPGRIR